MSKSNRERILGQDKDINGKLGKSTVKDAVGKFKEQYADRHENPNQPIVGFELNGGDGMTRGAKAVWNDFHDWCKEKQLEVEYNSNEDLEKIKTELRNRVDNDNKTNNRNK